jgi:GxxExxY protein
MTEDLLTKQVIGAAIEVRRHLGPGLLESSYQKCLQYELEKRGLSAKREVPV